MATKKASTSGSRPEKTGTEVGRIAGKALADPSSVTKTEIKKMAASLLTQLEKKRR